MINYLPKALVNNNIEGLIYNNECPNCKKESDISDVDFNKGFPIITCEACSISYLLIERGGKTKSVKYDSLIENIATLNSLMNNKLDLLLSKEEKLSLVLFNTYKLEDTERMYWEGDRIVSSKDETHYIPEAENKAMEDLLKNICVKKEFVTKHHFNYLWGMRSINVQVKKLNTAQGLVETITSLSLGGNLPGGKDSEYEFKIPSSITGLKNLKELWIDDLIIKDADNLAGLKGLRKLKLHNAKLTNVNYLKNMNELTYLDLSCNKLESAQGLSHLANLKSLSLDVNNIKEIRKEDNLWQLKNVNYFSIGRNELQELFFFPRAKTIRVFGNPCHPGID